MLKEKDRKILEEMKNHIKTLPLEERIPAVAIYRLTEDYFKQLAVEEAEEEKLDAEYKVAETAVLKINEEIITGQRKVDEQELTSLNQFLKEGENVDLNTMNVAKPIDEYWLTVLKNADIYMSDADHDVLRHLETINVREETVSESDKKIVATLKFKENPFFTNTQLSIEVTLVNDMPKSSKGTAINWKEGKNITVKTVQKTQKNKRSGAKRTVSKEIKSKSIFNLFADYTDKDEANESYNEEEEEQPNLYLVSDSLQQLQDVVPFSLEYYLGVVEKDDDGEEGDDEHDDDDEDEEEDEKPKKSKQSLILEGGDKPAKKDTGNAPAGAGGEPGKEECKKQ